MHALFLPLGEELMRKFLADFIYYLRRGYGIRNAWRLAQITI